MPPSQSIFIYKAEDESDRIILVTEDLAILEINLESFTISELASSGVFNSTGSKSQMRSYDKIVTTSHFNATSKLLVLAFANADFFSVVDLSGERAKLIWTLPSMQESCGTPLAMTSDLDKLLVAYDSNKIALFDLNNKCLHEWSRKNTQHLPRNFLSRYNRFVGVTQVNEYKYILYTNYTYCVLDINAKVPQDEVAITQDHPSRTVQGKQIEAQTWFDNLKLS